MHPKLTEGEKETLEEERCWCKENLKSLYKKINNLTDVKNNLFSDIYLWKERFEKADRKLAFATRLTVCNGKKKKEGIIKSFEKILEDKDKLKQFIKLLEDEGEIL